MKDQKKQMMGGCGGHCACAAGAKPDAEMTCKPEGEVALDKDGKCPCGKSADECCHKDKLVTGQKNDALDELCSPHGGKNVC